MIIYTKPLVIRILFENTQKSVISGISRPTVYLNETGNYSSIARFNLLDKEIKKGDKLIFDTIIDSPVGFGKHLHEGALLTVKNGLDEIGKAIVLDILRTL